MDPVIAEGVDAGAELEECEVRGSPSSSKVRFSVRVRLLHLSNHLNRGELEVDLGEVDLGEQKL